MRTGFRFLVTAVTAGLAAAIVLVALAPGRPAVEMGRSAQPLPPGGSSGPVSYARAVARALPAVVNVYTTKTVTRRLPGMPAPFRGQPFPLAPGSPDSLRETSLGSGVIFSKQGYILTNDHVIAGADEIQVLLDDGRTAAATVVGADPETDLAVLQVALEDLPTVVLGDSGTLQVGDVVLAIGNPFGVGQTVTLGIVSATGRSRLNISTFENFIQTDAAINPGNSGGALIDPHGRLVGINTAIFSQSGGSHGIGFAIPVHLATGVLQAIIEEGRVVRGWLGIEVQDVTPRLADSFGLAEARGVAVAAVRVPGPAHRAGLQVGDVIVAVDGTAVVDGRATLETVSRKRPGEEVVLAVVRDGRRSEHTVEVGERPANP